jgi:hypothetical protein
LQLKIGLKPGQSMLKTGLDDHNVEAAERPRELGRPRTNHAMGPKTGKNTTTAAHATDAKGDK